jgi:glutaconyl-CoA decarboxylase
MIRNFTITVNGQTYEVAVEEKKPAVGGATAAAIPVASQPAPAPKAPAPAPAPVAAPKPAQPSAAGGNAVCAPMPGVILNVSVNVGQAVNAGDVLLILEAMKMENDITCPASGTVKEIAVSKGSSVNTGDLMIVIE